MNAPLSPAEMYRHEADELLNDIEDALLDLEQAPGDTACINRLFRAVHTIKGSGAMFGFDRVADFAHHVETVLGHVREGRIGVSTRLIDLILAARDRIRAMLRPASDRLPDDGGTERLIAAFDALLPVSADKPPPADVFADSGETTWRIRFCPAADVAELVDPALILNELRKLGRCVITACLNRVPPLLQLNPFHCYIDWEIILTTAAELNAIRDVFIFVETGSRIDIEPMSAPLSPEKERRIVSDIPDSGRPTDVPETESGAAAPAPSGDSARQTPSAASGMVRIPSEKLDRLIDLVGELVITQSHLSRILATEGEPEKRKGFALAAALATPVESLSQLTDDLKNCALDMRMVPISTLFGKFRRLVRDLAGQLGKEVALITEGEKTTLDKSLIEHLGDPLVHLIRNSISHGIRRPDERERSGKPRQGTIRLGADHRGGRIIVTIEDDGVGMDPEAIRAKASERGIIAPDAPLSDPEIYALIFRPGFSTTRQVSQISGRGVGMDVVKRKIESLGGTVRIENRKGEYLRVILNLPLTLAIIEGLLVRVGDTQFVIPLAHIAECAELPPGQMPEGGITITRMRGKPLPVIRLDALFHIPSRISEPGNLIVVRGESFPAGLMVDELRGHIQAVVKSLGKYFQSADGISGATITGEGRVALILDIPGMLRLAQRQKMTGGNSAH